MPRTFTPYELTQLARAGIDPASISKNDTRPVEYITGKVDFCGLHFELTDQVLIPRIESEWLVDKAVALLQTLQPTGNKQLRVLDIGTGSGAIVISLAHRLAKRQDSLDFYASEISAQALEIAKLNAQKILGKNHQIKFFKSDLFEQLQTEAPFDLIIANLPYIPKSRIEYLDDSVKDHEPRVALDGGSSGFEIIKKMLSQAEQFVHKNSTIILEIDHTHTRDIWQAVSQKWQVNLELDEFSKNRFAVLKPFDKS